MYVEAVRGGSPLLHTPYGQGTSAPPATAALVRPARLALVVVPLDTGTPPRSALLAAWGNAWLAGDIALPQLLARMTAYDDDHRVIGLDGELELPLQQAVTRLRAAGAQRLRLVLPVPGDALGLPSPGPFTVAALNASEGVLALRSDGAGTGLVPTLHHHGSPFDGTVTTVTWNAYEVVVPGPDPGPFLHDAEHDLRRGIVEAASTLRELDVAHWQPEMAGALSEIRDQARRGIDDDELPGSYPQRARQLLVQARQLAGVLSLAVADMESSVDSRGATGREQALRELARLVRHARVAAYNAHGLAG